MERTLRDSELLTWGSEPSRGASCGSKTNYDVIALPPSSYAYSIFPILNLMKGSNIKSYDDQNKIKKVNISLEIFS